MTDIFQQTAQFNAEVCGIDPPQAPRMIEGERFDWFTGAVNEELDELARAETVEDQADAIIDLIYFAAGRLYEMGVNGRLGFELVHRANMLKEQGELSKRPGSLGHDAVKPAGWTAPDLTPIVKRPKILVLGYGRHGKDSVCEILSRRWGLKFTSSSMFCAERVMLPYFASRGIEYDDAEACYADRHNGDNRRIWFEQIAAFNEPDGSALARAILAENDVYCGMRSVIELEACKKAGVFDHIVWVDRSHHVPPEDETSCTVKRWMTDAEIDNNGTLEDLEEEVDAFMEDILL